jgi:hypothetical protein
MLWGSPWRARPNKDTTLGPLSSIFFKKEIIEYRREN